MAITFQYPVGLKHQIVEALKAVFANLADPRYRGIYIGLEYPLDRQLQYPAIFVTYSEGALQNVGVGHLDNVYTESQDPAIAKHFRFQGTVNFNIMALNTVDRDNIGAILVNLLALGTSMPEFEDFLPTLTNSKYLPIHLLIDMITPGGEAVSNVPWESEDERVYSRQYRVNLFGEFFSDPTTGDLIQIEDVEVYPYISGVQAPW